MFSLLYVLLLTFLHPSTAARSEELVEIATDIAGTDATEGEARLLVSICVHESRCSLKAVGDGGSAKGAWQVHSARGGAEDVGAAAALAKVRWSYAICGDLSAYAGCGRCGACPEIVRSLVDPKIPRK